MGRPSRGEQLPDGLKMTFRLRKDAKFQDGSPVTAEDVKWSLDRVVTAPVLGKAQLLTGSMTSADQFKVIDPLTIEVTLPKPLSRQDLVRWSRVAMDRATTEIATAASQERTVSSAA